ncbi:hypothetical protein E2C01_081989 [Portunus trituberculatus]|uniref:Uncharacterized protein n=1 Tax=Portunus trituberculatus TaxID=210409 RepID=A0A5B7J0D4_PORTR|nr:hypothetical protein [Portunus trituberculatus]
MCGQYAPLPGEITPVIRCAQTEGLWDGGSSPSMGNKGNTASRCPLRRVRPEAADTGREGA